jgi:branched-chain amino acid transport system ATP-binding protein
VAQGSTGNGPSSSALRVEQVSKRFGGLKVFEEISFALEPGGVLGVIGPNGAGKTTLINVVSRLLSASSGRILLGDTDITNKPFDSVSRLGVVRSFQQTNTFRSASVKENLSRAARFSASPAGPDLGLEGLLREFGLTARLEESSDKLPYGLQKMLGLLMALGTRPKFLLLDEPAAGLERRERTNIDRFVEHDMELIRRLCPHILVLESGRLLAAGSPEEVLSRRDVIDAYIGASEEETC